MIYKINKTRKIESKIDNTIKYVFDITEKNGTNHDNVTVEASYIDKGDGKDIICVSCQTGCNLGCEFCHLTGSGKEVHTFNKDTTVGLVDYIIKDLNLSVTASEKTLLVSYMGIGEPMRCIDEVILSATEIRSKYENKYNVVRFGMSTALSTEWLVTKLTRSVVENSLDMKLHFSLHSCDGAVRKTLIPSHSMTVLDTLNLLSKYKRESGNNVEIHYTLINNVNDRWNDWRSLGVLLAGREFSIKFLQFNIKEGSELKPAKPERAEFFMQTMKEYGIEAEVYTAPGADVGASCGQFSV